jgi:hypothetical protein
VRTIAATFESSSSAEAARGRLLTRSVPPAAITVADAVVAGSDDTPIDQPATIVAVQVAGRRPDVRDVLEGSGGHLVADVELDA